MCSSGLPNMYVCTVYMIYKCHIPIMLRPTHQTIMMAKTTRHDVRPVSRIYSLGRRYFAHTTNATNSSAGRYRGCTANVPGMSPVSRACVARCEPQPGQLYPVSSLNGHFGNGNLAGSNSAYTTIAAKTVATMAVYRYLRESDVKILRHSIR